MKDDNLDKDVSLAKEKKEKTVFGYNLLIKIIDNIPEKHRKWIVRVIFIAVLIIWFLDIIIADPLPYVDEAVLSYLLFILSKYLFS